MRTLPRSLALAGGAALALAGTLAGLAAGAGIAPAAAGPAVPDVAALAQPAPAAASGIDAELTLLAEEREPDRAAPGALRRRLLRLAARNLVHAEVTVDRRGTLATYQLDRGTIATVGPTGLTVAEAGGATESIVVTDATRVRKERAKAAVADLATGDAVVVLSQVEGGRATALVILVPSSGPAPAGASGQGAAPAAAPRS